MLIKVKAAKKSKVCKSAGKLDDVLCLVKLLMDPAPVDNIRLTYQDTDGETIDVLNQEDLDACIEEFRLTQRAKNSDDVRVTLVVADEFETIGMSRIDMSEDSSFLQGRSILNFAETPRLTTPPPTIEDIPLLDESIEEEIENLPIAEESQIIEATTESCFCHNNVKFQATATQETNTRQDFQRFFIELLTETDQEKLDAGFPLLFEPHKPLSRIRETVKKFINLVREKPIIQDARPRLNSTPLMNASIQTTDFVNRGTQPLATPPLPLEFGQSPSFPRFSNHQTGSQQGQGRQEVAGPVTQLFNQVAASAQALGRQVKHHVFDPLCSPLQQADYWQQHRHLQNQHHHLQRSMTDSGRRHEQWNHQSAPEDFSREQIYFLMKLRQYLRTNDIPANVLLWIQANWAKEVGDKNVMACYPELIATMERSGIIPIQDHGCTILHSPNLRHPFN